MMEHDHSANTRKHRLNMDSIYLASTDYVESRASYTTWITCRSWIIGDDPRTLYCRRSALLVLWPSLLPSDGQVTYLIGSSSVGNKRN